jgi:hypothetical protein
VSKLVSTNVQILSSLGGPGNAQIQSKETVSPVSGAVFRAVRSFLDMPAQVVGANAVTSS